MDNASVVRSGSQGGLLEVPVHLSEPSMSIVRASEITTVVAPTRDPDAASAVVRALTPSTGESAVEDGIAVTFDQFTLEASRRAILVVTSDVGLDAGRLARATDRALRDGVAIYVISLSPFVESEVEEVTYATGGGAWAVAPLDIVPTIDHVVADLRGQYELTVRLRGDDPSAPVTVAVSSGGVTARNRLRFAIPVTVALSGEATECEAPDIESGLPWPVLVAGACGLIVFTAGLIGVRSAVFHRSRERLEAG